MDRLVKRGGSLKKMAGKEKEGEVEIVFRENSSDKKVAS